MLLRLSQGFVLVVALGQGLSAQQPNEALRDTGTQAVHVVMGNFVQDSDVVSPKTGMPIGEKGKWSVGTQAPAECPKTTETCVSVSYTMAEASVTCRWVVKLGDEGDTGEILSSNADAEHYFVHRVSRIDADAQILSRQEAIYPAIALAAKIAGAIVVSAFVNPDGSVGKVFVVRGPEMLRQSAVDATKGWKFKPLVVGGHAVKYEIQVFYDFSTPYGKKELASVRMRP